MMIGIQKFFRGGSFMENKEIILMELLPPQSEVVKELFKYWKLKKPK